MKITLTDSEWVRLLDGQSEDSELQACCANISALRDELVKIVRQGRNSELHDWEVRDLHQKLKWATDGHEISKENFPALHKVMEQVGFDPNAVEHTKDRE